MCAETGLRLGQDGRCRRPAVLSGPIAYRLWFETIAAADCFAHLAPFEAAFT